jgi:putative flippase GtrA
VHILGNINIAASVVAYIVAFCISFPIGFALSRHIVFPESNLHGKIQFFRYALTTVTFIILTILMIKIFDGVLGAMPPNNESYAMVHTITYSFINITIAVLSYISQRKFTFKITPAVSVIENAVVD